MTLTTKPSGEDKSTLKIMNKKLKILHLEDLMSDAFLINRALKKEKLDYEILVADTKDKFIKALEDFLPDIILCDHSLPSFNSHEALKIIRAQQLDIPFILITATMTEEVAMTLIKEGADDFIIKDRLHRLSSAVLNAVEKYRLERERKRLLEETRKKEAISKRLLTDLSDKLVLATRAAGIGIWEYIIQTRKFICDETMYSIYGTTPEKFSGSYKEWKAYLHPEDGLWVDKLLKNALNEDESIRFGFRIIQSDKSLHYIEASAIVEKDNKGKLVRLVGTNRDITKDKAAEHAIEESEAKYRSFFETSVDGILLTMTDGQILSANPAACKIFQMTEEEICNLGRDGIADSTDPHLNVMLEERKRASRTKAEIMHIRKDGSKFPAEVTSSIFTHSSGHERASIIIRDITERKAAEQKIISTTNALQQAVNDLQKIMDSSLDIICCIDADGRFVSVSAASEKIWGFTPEELKGKRFMDFVYSGDVEKTLKINDAILSGLSVTSFENRYVHKNGRLVPLIWSSTWDNNEKIVYATAKDATEKKRLEEAFEAERQHFYDLFQQAPVYIGILKGPDHQYVMANQLYLQLIGKNNIIGKTMEEVLPEIVEQGFIKILNEVYETGNTFSANETLVSLNSGGDGKRKDSYLNIVYQAYRNNQGIIEGIFFFTVNVTEQVLSRKKIEESEKRFRTIVETAQEGIWMMDENDETAFVNQKMCEILEYSEEEMLASNLFSFKDKEEQKNAQEKAERGRKGIKETFESRYITKSGKRICTLVSASPITNEDGVYTGSISMITDITDRKQSEEKLIEYQHQLLESQRIAHIGSWQRDAASMTDPKSIPWMCSEEALRIIGYPTDYKEMTYNKFFSLVHPDDAGLVENAVQEVYKNLTYYTIDHRIILADGTVKWVHRDSKFIKDTVTGLPLKIIGTIQDTTEQKLREGELQKISQEREMLINELTNSLKDLKQFTYITSHNFKAPLSNLVGLTSLIDYSTLTEDNKEIVEMFKVSTFQLNKTINDLVEILIIKSNVNVNNADNNVICLFDNVCSYLSYEINETGCLISKDFKVENIYFNKSYLESILLNLLTNAIKYRSRDRKLKISISTEQKPNGEVLLTIKDNGIGIDLKRHGDRVFGLYQRFHSNVDSVGLGLFIVRSQITALGGKISLESEIDKGTTFYLTFKQNNLPEVFN